MPTKIEIMQGLLRRYHDTLENMRHLVEVTTNKEHRRDLQSMVETWEKIVESSKSEIELVYDQAGIVSAPPRSRGTVRPSGASQN